MVQTQFMEMMESTLCFLNTDSKSHALVNNLACSTRHIRGSSLARLNASR